MPYLIFDGNGGASDCILLRSFWSHRAAGQAYGSSWKSSRRRVAHPLLSNRAGSIADPFEQAWTIATHKEDLSPEEIQQRFAASLRGS
jgi:hypothetical protein